MFCLLWCGFQDNHAGGGQVGTDGESVVFAKAFKFRKR